MKMKIMVPSVSTIVVSAKEMETGMAGTIIEDKTYKGHCVLRTHEGLVGLPHLQRQWVWPSFSPKSAPDLRIELYPVGTIIQFTVGLKDSNEEV